jgi:hypothetical protein
VPVEVLALSDTEIAAATFKCHMDLLWNTGRPSKLGWERTEVDPLHTVVKFRAKRSTGEVDYYFVRLGAEYYDAAPPTVAFVTDDGQTHATLGNRWFPMIQPQPWFQLHTAYNFGVSGIRQLVCFSFTAEFYLSNHSPTPSERWKQGRHTVAATLNRIAEALSPPHYQKPSSK